MSATPKNYPTVHRSGSRRLYVFTPLALFAVAGVGVIGAKARVPDNEIAPGVQVGSLKLGGKTLDEARALLQQFADARQTTDLHLHFAEETGITKTWAADAHKLGLGLDVAATLEDAAKAGREGMLAHVSSVLTGSKTVAVPAHVTVDATQLRAYLKQIAYRVNRKPRNARLKLSGAEIADYLHDKPGLNVDVDGSLDAVTQTWTRFNGQESGVRSQESGDSAEKPEAGSRKPEAAGAPAVDPNAHQKPVEQGNKGSSGREETPPNPEHPNTRTPEHPIPEHPTPSSLNVELPAKATPAAITYEDIKQIDGVLGEKTTSVGGTSNRLSNVALAASRINGVTLRPGETFSYNKTVGPRDLEHGFKTAPEIVKGVLKPGVGGGVCQVSSTLFNAALFADMKIVDRSHHAFPVHYVDPGRDATVVDGDIDFKFQNSAEAPVYIYGKYHDEKLTFRVYGKKIPGHEVELIRGRESVGDYGTETETDASLPAGHRETKSPGHPRIDVTWYRVVKENGAEVRRDAISTHYRAIPAVVIVGTGAPRTRRVPSTGAAKTTKPVNSSASGAGTPAENGAAPLPEQ